jgi:protease-4
VAVVEVRGPISDEAPDAGADRVADVPHVTAALRACAEDPRVGAVVLYVDSPGGSALASDLMAREVERLRALKPVVAYFANVAASGGYYVSALAHKIVAEPTAITGSIGVIAMRVVVAEAAERAGVRHESVPRGARAELFSPYRKWTDDERAALDRSIDQVYEDFVRIVARGRGKSPDEIEPLARGRVYSARDALAVGLVDELGSFARAVQLAAQTAGLDASLDPVRVSARKLERGPIPDPSDKARAMVGEVLLRDALPWARLAQQCAREPVLLLDPSLAGVGA